MKALLNVPAFTFRFRMVRSKGLKNVGTKKEQKKIAQKVSLSIPSRLLDGSQVSSPISKVESVVAGSMYLARDFLTQDECRVWVEYSEQVGFEKVYHPASRYMAHRECGRIQIQDWSLAELLYDRMKQIVQSCHAQIQKGFAPAPGFSNYGPVSCNGNIRLYKYEKGMSFGKHIDESNRTERGITEITVLIYLTSCQGGATRFFLPHKKEVAIVPQAGTVLLHVHGDRCLEHSADAVQEGVKYILRTDIVYGECNLKHGKI